MTTQASLNVIYSEIKKLGREIEVIRSALVPEEEISDKERAEIRKVRAETKRGKRFRLDDVLAELNV